MCFGLLPAKFDTTENDKLILDEEDEVKDYVDSSDFDNSDSSDDDMEKEDEDDDEEDGTVSSVDESSDDSECINPKFKNKTHTKSRFPNKKPLITGNRNKKK